MTITLQTIQSAPLSDLKAFAFANDILIEGDKRKKATWVESITDFLIEGGAMEEVANQIDNGVVEDITLGSSLGVASSDDTLEELEASQAHYETILLTSTVECFVKSNVSPTEQAELEPVLPEVPNTTLSTNQANNNQLSFNQNTTALFPMRLVLWTLAIVIVPAVIVLGWVGNGSIKLVKITIPLMDTATTLVLEGIVWLTELLFGDGFDQYLDVKHLLRN